MARTLSPSSHKAPGLGYTEVMIHFHSRRRARLHQRFFGFWERPLRNERYFKLLIVATTCLVIAVILRSMPWGRYLADTFAASANDAVRLAAGQKRAREAVDDYWRRFRQLGIDTVRPRVERFFAKADPAHRRLLEYAGMDPEHMVLRWGNYNWTMLLASKVFDADDTGRSYRFKPNVHSIWLLHTPSEPDGPMFYQVPDGPGLAEAIEGTGAFPLETSRQVTNSWGLRGPEPLLDAPLRGIILGDSYMQGMFIGDCETPPEWLRRYLEDHLKTKVSILNTGVLGYSPEQYYFSLIAFADRFRPHFVVVSVFLNDFGYMGDVGNKGEGDWTEGKYWLEKIVAYCDARKCPYLIVPAPHPSHLFAKRNSGYYPGTLANILNIDSLKYLYPIEDFADAQLKFANEARRKGQPLQESECPLYNAPIGDSHFSGIGSEVWAEPVGRRLLLLLDGTLPSIAAKR